MAKYNVKKLKELAKKHGIKLKDHSYESDKYIVNDMDVIGAKIIRRVKFVSYKIGRKLFPNHANVYGGESTKNGIEFNSHEDLIKKIVDFKQ